MTNFAAYVIGPCLYFVFPARHARAQYRALKKKIHFPLVPASLKRQDGVKAVGSVREIAVRLEGGKDLNASDAGHGLSIVIRLYKLRNQAGFLSMPYSALGISPREKMTIGEDLIEVKEVTLGPGQKLDLKEKMPGDAAFLGIVALFHSPFASRWRFAFDTSEAERSGITVGVHKCAMTATARHLAAWFRMTRLYCRQLDANDLSITTV